MARRSKSRKPRGFAAVERRYSARDYAEVAAYRQPFRSRAVRRSLAARLLGSEPRRLKDLAPALALRRVVTPRRVRRVLASVNILHSPKRYVRQGVLLAVSPRYRERVRVARQLEACHRGKTARRHQVFKHLHRGGRGADVFHHLPHRREHARC